MLYVCFLVGASYPCPMGNQGGYRSKGPCVVGEMDRKGVGVETPSEPNQSILIYLGYFRFTLFLTSIQS